MWKFSRRNEEHYQRLRFFGLRLLASFSSFQYEHLMNYYYWSCSCYGLPMWYWISLKAHHQAEADPGRLAYTNSGKFSFIGGYRFVTWGEIPPLPHWSRPCLIVVVRLFPLSFPCYFLLVLLLLPSLDWFICLQLHAFLNSFHITPTSRLLVSFSSCYRTKYKFRRKMFILSDVTAWYVCTICFVL